MDLGVRQGQRMFRQLGFRLRKPGLAIGQADPERQKAQKNSKDSWKMPAVYHWATDEGHFEQRGQLSHVGAPFKQGSRAACDTSVPRVCAMESLRSLGNRVSFTR